MEDVFNLQPRPAYCRRARLRSSDGADPNLATRAATTPTIAAAASTLASATARSSRAKRRRLLCRSAPIRLCARWRSPTTRSILGCSNTMPPLPCRPHPRPLSAAPAIPSARCGHVYRLATPTLEPSCQHVTAGAEVLEGASYNARMGRCCRCVLRGSKYARRTKLGSYNAATLRRGSGWLVGRS
jgi:hypothetical protein